MAHISSIYEATQAYEAWLAGCTDLVRSDLEYKHEKMADGADPFPFFRGTYYRWAQRWPTVCESLVHAPRLLSVGDLHIENFGTWRDMDGRLCWGVNDYDEADELPFTHDLVRLAASVRFAQSGEGVEVKLKAVCAAILDGYLATMKLGGDPFVLEERHPELRNLAMSADRDPVVFWKKLTKLLTTPAVEPPGAAVEALIGNLPAANLKVEFRSRSQIGIGSLGKPRYVALAECAGGWVAREAKIVTPSATAWVSGQNAPSRIAEIVANAKHSPDPFYRPGPTWISRRLAPRCSRIELSHLTVLEDVTVLFRSMGAEVANIHLGSVTNTAEVVEFLKHQPDGWLPVAAKAMVEAVRADWQEWRSGHVPIPARG